MLRIRFSLLSVCLVVLFFTQACSEKMLDDIVTTYVSTFGDPVVVDTKDATAPTASLMFTDPATGNKVVMKSGDPSKTITINKNDQFILAFIGEDPQGVKSIKGIPGIYYWCQYPDGTSVKMMSSTSPWDLTIDAGPGETVTTRLWFGKWIHGNLDPCGPDSKAGSGYISAVAKAENFSGMESWSPTVTFFIPH